MRFYFGYLYAGVFARYVSLVPRLHGLVFSVMAAIAKQSQFHPDGLDYPAALF